jgi:integrase
MGGPCARWHPSRGLRRRTSHGVICWTCGRNPQSPRPRCRAHLRHDCGQPVELGSRLRLECQPGATRRLLEDLPSGELPAWSRVEADLACQHLPERLRRAVVLGMHTGQRRGDLIAMRWSDYDGAAIRIVQQKTGTELVIPVVPELKAELDAWKPSVMDMSGKTAGTILLTDASEPWTETNLSTQMSRYLDKVPGFPSGRNIHGLRKLVAASLAAAAVPCTRS